MFSAGHEPDVGAELAAAAAVAVGVAICGSSVTTAWTLRD
jgi:hypothetical protein